MREKELKSIIDREKHKGDARQVFSKQIDLLVDLVNYGSNLIVRAYDSSAKKLKDMIVIIVLLKQVVLMVDAIEILVSNGSGEVGKLQVRTAFEASLFIDWILKEESEKKAKYYYISNLRKQKLWTLRYIKGTTENELFLKSISDLLEYMEPGTTYDEDVKEAERQAQEIADLLEKGEWKEINEDFNKIQRRRTGYEPHWYEPLGTSSIKKLAEEVGRLSEYILFYTTGSEFAHTASYTEHAIISKGQIRIEPIRQLRGAHSILQNIIIVTLSSYQSVLRHYRHGELSVFGKKYVTEWRNAYQNIPNVTYKEEDE